IKLSPLSPEIHNTLGNALRQKGEMEAARAEFQEAARLNKLKSNNQAATFDTNTGTQKMKEGDLAAAISLFESAIKKDPNYAPAHYQLGLALRKKGQTKAAAEAFQRAQQLDRRLKPPTP
ncbi:MAG TPA: tetratricopeptide repeat protein, partial [Blastocatellia bacterium]|nr:tetratricopeptide repeat protein [Blastocatellia bacterium]